MVYGVKCGLQCRVWGTGGQTSEGVMGRGKKSCHAGMGEMGGSGQGSAE